MILIVEFLLFKLLKKKGGVGTRQSPFTKRIQKAVSVMFTKRKKK